MYIYSQKTFVLEFLHNHRILLLPWKKKNVFLTKREMAQTGVILSYDASFKLPWKALLKINIKTFPPFTTNFCTIYDNSIILGRPLPSQNCSTLQAFLDFLEMTLEFKRDSLLLFNPFGNQILKIYKCPEGGG